MLLLIVAGCRDLVVPNEVIEGKFAPVVRGTVFGPDGQPLPFARVAARNLSFLPYPRPPGAIVDWDGSTDEHGHFDSGLLAYGVPVDIHVDPAGSLLPSFSWQELEVPVGGMEVFYFPNNLQGEVRVTLDGAPATFDRIDVGARGVFAGTGQYIETQFHATTRYALPVPPTHVEIEVDLSRSPGDMQLEWLKLHQVEPGVDHDLMVALVEQSLSLQLGNQPYPDHDLRVNVRAGTDEISLRSNQYLEPNDGVITFQTLAGSGGELYITAADGLFHLPRVVDFDLGSATVPGVVQMGEHRVVIELVDEGGGRSFATYLELEGLQGNHLTWLRPLPGGVVYLPTGHYRLTVSQPFELPTSEHFVDGDTALLLPGP